MQHYRWNRQRNPDPGGPGCKAPAWKECWIGYRRSTMVTGRTDAARTRPNHFAVAFNSDPVGLIISQNYRRPTRAYSTPTARKIQPTGWRGRREDTSAPTVVKPIVMRGKSLMSDQQLIFTRDRRLVCG